MRLTCHLLLVLASTSLTSCQEQSWGLWPLYTPLLGDISSQCKTASQEYVADTQEALQTVAMGGQLSDKHRTALAMFDAAGALPFLQEGHLSDTYPFDLCDILAPEEAANQGCKAQVPAVIRVLSVPFGHVMGPGAESQCRQNQGNYCYNYFQPFPPVTSAEETSLTSLLRPENFPGPVRPPVLRLSPGLDQGRGELFNLTSSPGPATSLESGTATSEPGQLLELILTRSDKMRKIHRQVLQFLERSGLVRDLSQQNVVLQVLGLILFLWGTVNQNAGVGEWGKQAPLPYQGVCYPPACSKLDIQTNNIEFYKTFAVPNFPMAAPSPLISDYLAVLTGIDAATADKFRETNVGCTDDYTGHWRPESYVMLVVLVIIGVCILLGTLMDIYETNQFLDKPLDVKKKPSGLPSEIIKSFSMVQNLKFIFQKPSGSSQRLGCLEGMRSMSMTWVILGRLRKQQYKNICFTSNHNIIFFFES